MFQKGVHLEVHVCLGLGEGGLVLRKGLVTLCESGDDFFKTFDGGLSGVVFQHSGSKSDYLLSMLSTNYED